MKLGQAGHTTWSELGAIQQRSNHYEEQLQTTNGQVSEILVRMKDLQAQAAYGASTGSPQGGQFTGNGATGGKNIMEYRSISMMEKLTGDAKEFNIWSLRLKNTFKQINPLYATLLELIERLPTAVATYDNWLSNYLTPLMTHSQTEESMFNRMSCDLYTLLVDKCTNSQVNVFENTGLDRFYAYNQLYRSATCTAGLGSLERREYITNPQVAKKECEVYDLIMAWETEIKEQEKATPAEFRPLLSPIMKMSVMKKIAYGNIKEHIRTHKAIQSYDELRNEVLTMAMFNKTESNKVTQAPAAMDLNASMEKIRESIKSEGNYNSCFNNTGHESKVNDLGGEKIKETTGTDAMVSELMAMVKGKGKGRETRECFICAKTGHLAKDCWNNPKGKGKGGKGFTGTKGYNPKGYGKGGDAYGKGGDVKGKGKGGPKGGCWTCG